MREECTKVRCAGLVKECMRQLVPERTSRFKGVCQERARHVMPLLLPNELGGAAGEPGEEREIGRDAEVFGAPTAHFFHEGNEIAARFGERVGDFRRGIVGGFARNDAVLFEFAKLRGEDFFCDAGEKIAKFGEALRLEREIPKRENFPFAGHDV